MEQPVAFTAKFKTSHVSGLGSEQTLKFDNVMYNAGGGYDPVSGHFTAPSSGTYAFFLKATSAGEYVRGRRSDDNGPLELVVNGLSEKLTQLTAQVQAMDTKLTNKNQAQDASLVSQEAEINSLKGRLEIQC
nr:hypothetical protein BaRGS_008717 [Batillaria attramentaria]